MSRDCLTVTKGEISKFSSKSWMNSGMAFRGEYSMLNTLEHPNDVEECTLSQVLEISAPLKYFLKKAHLVSLLERASERKKPLPTDLEEAIKKQIAMLSNMRVLEENRQLALKPRDTETTEKATRSTAGAVQTLYVRRLMPSECEKLQGFPTNWTAIDIEP